MIEIIKRQFNNLGSVPRFTTYEIIHYQTLLGLFSIKIFFATKSQSQKGKSITFFSNPLVTSCLCGREESVLNHQILLLKKKELLEKGAVENEKSSLEGAEESKYLTEFLS